MMNNSVLLNAGIELLTDNFGLVDTERFISLLNLERFDYTKWREEHLFKDMSIEEISRKAMEYRNSKKNN